MKKFNLFIILLTSIFSYLYLIFNFTHLTLSEILILLVIVPVLFLVRMVRHFFHIKIDDTTELIYILFIIFAQLIGSTFKVYDLIGCYDNIVHYSSGVLTSTFALVLLNNSKLKNRNLFTDIIFILSFTLAVASLWEFFEFTCDHLLGGDAQRVLESGVTDTMTDMICAFLGSSLFVLFYSFKKPVNN